ncbi:Alkanesulfonate monooxygenase [Streptomyces sp. RB5]|uniref:Alkanesulfonate monooxygenase n=1 Tax=Streptomyces smaragdinus TaxID=2585196 RepID=A0A7K0CJT2_9ACTN|nr:LLM class flavin-dependent oxidoreductase [Streptomyces smaragdinus]MQY13750.1 Alkanesulfonate monooxygenase [Streptomyces smaragdinus]
MTTFAISLDAEPNDAPSWLALARRCEAAGFAALLAPDHPGSCASPFVALAAAAAVTERLELGSYVSQGGIREPLLLAADVATLDVVSAGRARLGLGTGHTPAEWEMLGSSRPDVDGRVRRFTAVAEAIRALLAGEEVTVDAPELTHRAARLTEPRPVRERIPFTFGGGNSTLLRWAGAHADVVGLSGLGRTLADGHRHLPRFAAAEVDRQVALVHEGAAGREAPPVLEALVQLVEVTDDAGAAAERLADRFRCSAEDVLATPYVWVGTEDEIRAELVSHGERWGITRFVVREPAFDTAAALLAG